MNRLYRLPVAGREIVVYVPPGYREEGDRKYPVVYVQDGEELVGSCINQLEHLTAQGKLPPLIIAGVPPHNRNAEYTPWPAKALLEGYPDFGGEGRAYVDVLADVIKPAVDERFRTLPEPEHTAVAGGSFGGLITMFAGYWRPDAFGKLGMLSPSLWYEGVMAFIREKGPPPHGLRIYMSVGDSEGIYKTTIQRSMVQSNTETYRTWLDKGFPADRLRLNVKEGGTHDLIHMGEQLPLALQWLFGDQTAAVSHNGLGAGEAPGYAVPGTCAFGMVSKNSGRTYRLFVSVPAAPPPADGYPVLYALDGNAIFASFAEAMRLQGRKPHGIEPQIVVGIGYDSDAPLVTEERFLDYTEPAPVSALPARPDGSAWPRNGGAEHFIHMIEEQIKPEIERRWPIDRGRQSLFGHSLGGYFALYVMLTRPGAYRKYIAGSPSVWWNSHSLLHRLAEAEERLRQAGAGAELLIAVGTEEKTSMVEDAEKLYEKLKPNFGHSMRLSFRKFDGEGHVSVLHPLISETLRFISR